MTAPRPRLVSAAGWALAGLLTVLAVAWPDGNTYERYRQFLVEAPAHLQALAGLALLLVPAVVAAAGWFARPRSRAAHAVFLVACAAWFAVDAHLRIHLSAPDFDDFFVVDKLTATVDPNWFNDKPFFTLWDYPYRWSLGAPAGPLGCFAVNGWFAIAYVVLTGLWLERALPAMLGRRWPASSPLAAWLPWAAALWLGPVVLAHTVAYELACATWVLAACVVLERLRTARRAPPAFLALAILALARWLQQGGHNATAMAWIPVYVHALLVMRRWRAPVLGQAWGAALVVDAALDVLMRQRQRLDDTVNNFDTHQLRTIVRGGVVPLLVALAVLWLLRRPRARLAFPRFLALALDRPSVWHVWLAYLVAGAAIYLLANQANLGVPIPGYTALAKDIPWDYATNHARYAVTFYPFLATLLCVLLVPWGRAGVLLLAACSVAWNAAYVVRFYAGPRGVPAAVDGYRRNSRFLEAMQEALRGVPPAERVAYVPIPRDHGDQYLVRAADPGRHFVSVCAGSARDQPSLPVLVTGYALVVIGKENGMGLFDVPAGALEGDLVKLRMGDLSPKALDAWCSDPRVAAWSTEPGRR